MITHGSTRRREGRSHFVEVGLTVALVVLVLALPSLASACPVCAQNTSDDRVFRYLLLAMMLLPYPVAAVVFWLIRRGQREHAGEPPQAPLE